MSAARSASGPRSGRPVVARMLGAGTGAAVVALPRPGEPRTVRRAARPPRPPPASSWWPPLPPQRRRRPCPRRPPESLAASDAAAVPAADSAAVAPLSRVAWPPPFPPPGRATTTPMTAIAAAAASPPAIRRWRRARRARSIGTTAPPLTALDTPRRRRPRPLQPLPRCRDQPAAGRAARAAASIASRCSGGSGSTGWASASRTWRWRSTRAITSGSASTSGPLVVRQLAVQVGRRQLVGIEREVVGRVAHGRSL